MILKTALFLSSLLLFFTIQLVSQTSITDKHPSGNSTQLPPIDTATVNKNVETARKNFYSGGEVDTYIKLARKQAKAIKYYTALAKTYNLEANVLSRKGNYAEGFLMADSALTIGKEIKDSISMSLSYLLLGNLQCYMGKYGKGLDYYFKGLALEER